MKKILALLLAVITLISISACGGKQEIEGSVEADNKIEETEDKKDVTAEAEKEETKKEETKKEEKPQINKEEKPQVNNQTANENKPQEKPAEKPAVTPEVKPETKPEEKPQEKPAEKPQETPKTAGNILLSDFKAKATAGATALSIAESLSTNSIIPFMAAAMPVEPGYLSGFNNEIHGFKEGAMFGPVIGSIPFVGYVFTMEDGADISKFIQTLKAEANLRWNICVEAEEMVAGSAANKVFFVMTNKTFEE